MSRLSTSQSSLSPSSPSSSSPFRPQPPLQQFLESPIHFFASRLHALFLLLRAPPRRLVPSAPPIRVVCISDTHTNTTQDIPSGDLLIHAGDLTNNGRATDIQAQIDWLRSLPHPHKVVIAGNHDGFLDARSRTPEDNDLSLDWGEIHYLERSSVTLTFLPSRALSASDDDRSSSSSSLSPEPSLSSPSLLHTRPRTLHIYGAPQIPRCGGDDFAFQYERSSDEWTGSVPVEADVLVTHTPPRYHLDLPVALGCDFLRAEVWRTRPTLHVFGHVHAGYGKAPVFWDHSQRLYERLRAKPQRGLVAEMLDWRGWADVVALIGLDVVAVLRSRVLGLLPSLFSSSHTNAGWMVNAALVSPSDTQRLVNPPQVVDL
ncbi:MAG: hypothetical protein M1825_002173 [Sarcosagium campestre]|nr:MAG: hypothetical protein M1825_002173 [Sarcosagium campestre]